MIPFFTEGISQDDDRLHQGNKSQGDRGVEYEFWTVYCVSCEVQPTILSEIYNLIIDDTPPLYTNF